MKVLFVGEGPHDVGRDTGGSQPWQAGGVVTGLARRVCPSIDEAVALSWRDLSRFTPRRRSDLAAKVAAAILVSSSRFGCEGTVCVADSDRHPERIAELREGRARGLNAINKPHRVVCGLAVESIESWTLGAQDALSGVIGVPLADIQNEYQAHDAESFYQNSDKESQKPKDLLQRLAELGGMVDCQTLREDIASQTNVEALMRACPRGFGPFAKELIAEFGGED